MFRSRRGGDRTKARHAGLHTIEQLVKSGAWLGGSPELITEQLMALQNRFPGLEEVNVGREEMSATQEVIIEQLELLADEAMPAFKMRAVA